MTPETERFFALPPHAGLPYYQALNWIHAALEPRTYFEIGSATGISLSMARCASLAVDPAFQLQADEARGDKPLLKLFETTSDAFFAEHDPAAELGAPIDLAFLDGMHEFEFLLRDFIGTERACAPSSLILMHDCLPTDSHVARREQGDLRLAEAAVEPDWWAGDLWRTVLILRGLRPDLIIQALDAPPTGLVAVSGLDPSSTILADGYEAAVAEAATWAFTEARARALFDSLTWVSTAAPTVETWRDAFPLTAAWRPAPAPVPTPAPKRRRWMNWAS